MPTRAEYSAIRSLSRILLLSMLTCAGLSSPARAQGEFRTLILSPEPGEIVPQTAGVVALSIIDPAGVLDVTSLRVLLDGSDVTGDANVSGDVVVWVPRSALRRGIHSIVITMKQTDGTALPTVSWSFITGPPPEGVDVTEERLRPGETEVRKLTVWDRVDGNVRLEGAMYAIGGDGAEFRRQAPATAKAWMNLNSRLGGSWRWAATTHLNSYESHTRQPVNRYRFDLNSNWLTVGVGDVMPRMQDLILWGRRVRGFSLDLRGGIANLMVTSGQSRRAVEPQLYGTEPWRVYRQGAYEQELLAIRPYFGSGKTWQFGITVLKARDIMDSITPLRTEADTASGSSSTLSANPLPKDNLVAGFDYSHRLLRGRLTLSYNNAFSLFANDISSGPLSAAELDSIFEANGSDPINLDPAKYENIFILNQSLIPIDPRGLTSLAQQIRASLALGTHTLGATWRSIGGSYYTLGQTSLQRDRSGLRVQDSFRMLQNSLNVVLGWESYRDNLDGNKTTTTGNSAVTLDLSWQSDADRPGFSVGYRDYARSNDAPNLGSGAMNENTLTYSLGTFVPLNLFSGYRTRLNVNYVSMGRDDAINPLTGTSNTYYLVGLTARMPDQPTEFSAQYGLNTTELTGYDSSTTFHRVVLRGRHAFAARLVGSADVTLTEAVTPDQAALGAIAYSRRELFAGGEYYWTQSFFASVRAGISSYADKIRAGVDTNEFTLILRLNRSF